MSSHKHHRKDHKSYLLVTIAAILSGLMVFLYKVCFSNKAKGGTKILLYLNSMAMSDLSLRKYEGKLSILNALLLRVVQKFINLIVSKMLLYRELPTLRDQTYFVLLMLHFIIVYLFQLQNEKGWLNKFQKSKVRVMIQETFKGLGKGVNLLSYVSKGLLFHNEFFQFIGTLFIRLLASSMIKSFYISMILKKKMKYKKMHLNLLFHVVPTATLYISCYILRNYLTSCLDAEHELIVFFLVFMVSGRFVRAQLKVMKMFMKKGKFYKVKRMRKLQKKLAKRNGTLEQFHNEGVIFNIGDLFYKVCSLNGLKRDPNIVNEQNQLVKKHLKQD